ncbi:MAG TPA: transporter [Elusimicrobia bacterium]|nr:MAG: transporter [Elusimicrobia bacterium GWA2_66_18]HAZ08725.1 transporter [Elusimicrobiota bacterium]
MSRPPLRLDRREIAGAFGDLGTSFPLLVGMTLACGLDGGSVLAVFGALQVATALVYHMPMPVQPLKAMAAIAIAQRLPAATLAGGGLAVGVLMLLLTLTGLLESLARAVPKTVVRGIQCGLGLQLSGLACHEFLPAGGCAGWVLAAVSAAVVVALLGDERRPPALILIVLGLTWSSATVLDGGMLAAGFGLRLPAFALPSLADIWTGALVLALPQIPLSLGNSVLATRQVSLDLFPDRAPDVLKIGFTYSAMNLLAPLFGGVPVCHGSGGMVGHSAFGGRTGGSVLVYGMMFLVLGLFFGGAFGEVVRVFPRPMLGVLLLFEGLAMLSLVRDQAHDKEDFAIVMLTGLACAGLPYGYLVGMAGGTLLHRLKGRTGLKSLR